MNARKLSEWYAAVADAKEALAACLAVRWMRRRWGL